MLWGFWLGLFLPKTISRLLAYEGVSIKSWIMLFIWIVGSVPILWFGTKLKKVIINYRGKLLVSNYIKVIEVKPEDITHIYYMNASLPERFLPLIYPQN